LLIIVFSCSNEDNKQKPIDEKQSNKDETEITQDTNLTPEEKFTVSILTDFLNDSDDEDLASFLETEIYKMRTNYNGAAIAEITPSTWIVALEKDGSVKNYILQKYVDFTTNEYYFTMKETNLNITDFIIRTKVKAAQ
jgi:hypothetical protein